MNFAIKVQPVGSVWMNIVLARIFIHRFPLRERPVNEQKELWKQQRSAGRHDFCEWALLNVTFRHKNSCKIAQHIEIVFLSPWKIMACVFYSYLHNKRFKSTIFFTHFLIPPSILKSV